MAISLFISSGTTLLDEDGTSLESITRRIGLRTLTISQEKRRMGK